jgi:AefR-like transcriptional repressor, C-terminal domain
VPDVYREWLLTGPVKGWQLVARLIDEGKATGEFRADADGEVAARLLTSGLMQQLNWMRAGCLGDEAAIDRDRLIDSALDLVLRGLRPSPPAPSGVAR